MLTKAEPSDAYNMLHSFFGIATHGTFVLIGARKTAYRHLLFSCDLQELCSSKCFFGKLLSGQITDASTSEVMVSWVKI